jgi:hypothetical protein
MNPTFAKFLLAVATASASGVMAQTLPGPLPTDFGAFLSPQLEGGSRYRLAVGTDMAFDNNIYRAPRRGPEVLYQGTLYPYEGWISRYYAQGNIDLPVSRQRFLGQVSGSAYQFREHGYLNYTALDYRVGWLWEAGDRLKGVLRYEHQDGLADFIDVRPFTKNVRTYENWIANAEYSVTPRWVLTGGFTGYNAKNGDPGFAPGDLRQTMTEVGVKYNATGLNFIKVFYAMADGKYPNRVQTRTLDDQFEQRDIGVGGLYQITDATNFVGRYVLTRREFPDVPANNQTKPNWRIDFNWAFSPKTAINLNTRKEYGVFEDALVTSSAYLNTVYGIAPWWEIVPTVRLELAYERWQRDISELTPPRSDDLSFWRLSARWTPTRDWLARIGLLQSKRSSTVDTLNFTDRVVYGTVEYRF